MANNVNIVINAQDKASQALGRVSDKAKSMRGQFLAMTAIGGAVTGALGMMTKSALDQEIGVRKLDSALKNVNTSYESQAVVIEKTLRALQDKTNFGDEEQREALTALIRLTGDYEGSLKALPVIMDLAVGANMDFKNASQLMGKVLSGQTTALTRYGITLDKNATQTEILEELTKKFGGAAEAAFDPINAMQNELGDLGQEIGNVLLPMFISFMDKIIPIIKSVVEWSNKNPALMKSIVLATGAIGGILVFLGLLGLALPPITGGIIAMTVAWTAFSVAFIANPVGLAITGFVLGVISIAMGIKAIINNWDECVEAFKIGINALIGPFNSLIDAFNRLTGANLDTIEKFELVSDRVAEKTKALGDTSAEAYKDVWRTADHMTKSFDETNISIGQVDDSLQKLNETTKTSIGLTEKQDYTVKKFYVNYASKVGYTGELINHFIEDHMRLDDERMANKERIANKEVELEQETVDKKKEINETYLDEFHDMYEEMIIETAGLVNKAHEEMIHELSARDKANKKAQLDESTIPGLSNLPGMKLGREASQVSAIMSANLSGGLRKASGEMMTSAEMREFLGIKLSDTGSIPTIGGTGIPVHEVNINVSPELDAQINFNRVADTLRQKQGDITSNEGQW